MGIFSSIMNKLGFGDDEKQEEQAAAEEVSAAPEESENLAETSKPEVVVVDVTAKLNDLAANNSEGLDWKASIVDLMKLLGLNSSYGHRKELAGEMGIEGYEGTAEQNIALHKAVLQKLVDNGGNIPTDLLD